MRADGDNIKKGLASKETEKIAKENSFYKTKPLDELNGRESELRRQNEEDQAIIQDENVFPSDREAAEARVVERN